MYHVGGPSGQVGKKSIENSKCNFAEKDMPNWHVSYVLIFYTYTKKLWWKGVGAGKIVFLCKLMINYPLVSKASRGVF